MSSLPGTKKIHVKKGDVVMVVAGKSRGKKGKVIRVEPATGRVVVEGVNVVKKHTKPTKKVMQGGIIDMEAPIAASNVMFFCSRCGRPARLGAKTLEDGRSVRVCARCGEVVDK